MEKKVIIGTGTCGLHVELSMFNVYKLQEIREEFNRAKKDSDRYNELKKLGYDKQTDEQKEELRNLKPNVDLNTLDKVRKFLNNLLNDFVEKEDDLFTETTTVAIEPQAPIGTRENPRMFEEESSYILP